MSERREALKEFIEKAEEYSNENIPQSERYEEDEEDEALRPIVQTSVKPAVQRLQRIYGRGKKPKLPYPQSLWWRNLIRYTDLGKRLPPEEAGRRNDLAEEYLNKLLEWAKNELKPPARTTEGTPTNGEPVGGPGGPTASVPEEARHESLLDQVVERTVDQVVERTVEQVVERTRIEPKKEEFRGQHT